MATPGQAVEWLLQLRGVTVTVTLISIVSPELMSPDLRSEMCDGRDGDTPIMENLAGTRCARMVQTAADLHKGGGGKAAARSHPTRDGGPVVRLLRE